MNSARARGLHRIRQATVTLGALGLVITGGSMALAHDDVQAAAGQTTTTTGSTTTSTTSTDSSSSSAGTSLGTGSGTSSARSAGS